MRKRKVPEAAVQICQQAGNIWLARRLDKYVYKPVTSGWRGGSTNMSTSRQHLVGEATGQIIMSTSRRHQQDATAARLRGQLRTSAGCRRCRMAIPGPGRRDSTTLAGHLSRRRKTLNRNQVAAKAFTRPTCGKENPKKNRVQGRPP